MNTTAHPDTVVSPCGAGAFQLCERVLLASSTDRASGRTLQEASAFARRLGAEIHVVRVLPHPEPSVSGGSLTLAKVTRDAQRVLAATRRLRRLCDRMLSQVFPADRLGVRLGPFVDQVALRAFEIGATLIVVPRATRRLVPTVMGLLEQTRRPVLVPRGRTNYLTLLAATNLEDPRTPVLVRTAELGHALEASLVALHSHSDVSGAASSGSIDGCMLRLERAARAVHRGFEPIVRRAADPVDCILEQAQARDADLIVVGAYNRRDRTRPDTAARLLGRAQRSVLVMPV